MVPGGRHGSKQLCPQPFEFSRTAWKWNNPYHLLLLKCFGRSNTHGRVPRLERLLEEKRGNKLGADTFCSLRSHMLILTKNINVGISAMC